MTELPNTKIRTLKEAKQEMSKFGITAKVSTLFQAKKLLLGKRAELVKATKPSKPKQPATPSIPNYPKEHQPKVEAQRHATAKPATQVDEVMAFYNLEVRRLRGETILRKEMEPFSAKDNDELKTISGILTRAIQTLCKTGYREGLLLSRAHSILQEHSLTKDLDPRDMLKDIKDAQAVKQKKDAERASIPSFHYTK